MQDRLFMGYYNFKAGALLLSKTIDQLNNENFNPPFHFLEPIKLSNVAVHRDPYHMIITLTGRQ